MPITITEEFIRSLATSRQDVLEAETLPPECYTDANRDFQCWFQRQWYQYRRQQE